MKRIAKAKHGDQLAQARETGYTGTDFASPKLVRAARADRGHSRMTAEEYRRERMHRRGGRVPASSIRRDNATTKIQALRNFLKK